MLGLKVRENGGVVRDYDHDEVHTAQLAPSVRPVFDIESRLTINLEVHTSWPRPFCPINSIGRAFLLKPLLLTLPAASEPAGLLRRVEAAAAKAALITSLPPSSACRSRSLSAAVTATEPRFRGVRTFEGPGDGGGELLRSPSLPGRDDSACAGEMGADIRRA